MSDWHIAAALRQLTAAAKSEKKSRQAEFAEALMLHAQNGTRQRCWSAIISSSGPRLIVHDQRSLELPRKSTAERHQRRTG